MPMKSGVSALNPFAESYIPLAKRDVSKVNEDYKSMMESVAAPDAFASQKLPSADYSKLKVYGTTVTQSQIPNEMIEKKSMDEEMDLAYLQMTFPGLSDQSITDVYLANRGDLECAIDMLSHLESCTIESVLPDALDIGDVPAPASMGECSSGKAKHVAGESSSTSVSGNLAAQS